MNMPGFTAEACIYSTRNYYTINVPGVGAGIRTIVASLISDGGGRSSALALARRAQCYARAPRTVNVVRRAAQLKTVGFIARMIPLL
jgi:hypothetical protein